MNPNYWICWSG